MEIYKDLSSQASQHFQKLLNSQLSKNKIEEGKIIDGKVTKITDKYVFLFIQGLKSEPVVDINEIKMIGMEDKIFEGSIISVLLVGLGSGFYLIANLGPGPRDGLMTGLQRKTNFPIATVRAFLEISVVLTGWYLGGTVGIGTLLFAFGVGPAVALGLYIVEKFFNSR